MPITLPPWSYTHIDTFENCPHQYHWKYILKNKEPTSPEMEEGRRAHDALEKRVAANVSLPANYAKWEPLAASIVKIANDTGGEIRTEMKVGVDRDLKPCDFFAKNVYARGALDVSVLWPTAMYIGDWKTGKTREKDFQVKIFAFFGFLTFPKVNKITACNIWLPTGKIGEPYNYDRADLPRIWSDIYLRLVAMETAAASDTWAKRQSPLCGFCPVKDCENNRSKK